VCLRMRRVALVVSVEIIGDGIVARHRWRHFGCLEFWRFEGEVWFSWTLLVGQVFLLSEVGDMAVN